MKYLFVKALVTGILLTSTGKVLASTNDYDYHKCIGLEEWENKGKHHAKYSNNEGNRLQCSGIKININPKIWCYPSESNEPILAAATTVTLSRYEKFEFSAEKGSNRVCVANF